MPRDFSVEMGFPPFRGAVRQIILGSTAIYVVILLLVSFEPAAGQRLVVLERWIPFTFGRDGCGSLLPILSFTSTLSISRCHCWEFISWEGRWKSVPGRVDFTGCSLAA